MSKLEDIKFKILQMEAGSFQNLCDCYLSKKGYKNIVSYGSHAGTHKTTFGTPDTYFLDEMGKYVFVEYTVQQNNIASKISDDIEKCLDSSSTGINTDNISEIIYCYTSSNLSPESHSKFVERCKSVGIKLDLIGIDELARDLFLNYKSLVKDYLEISIDTDQVLDVDSFVEKNSRNIVFAPLDTKFSFRDSEIKEIDNSFNEADIVILEGPSGCGKTRLALKYAEMHAEKNDETIICIRNNGQPLFDDLKSATEKPSNYFVIIDDANQLSGINNIVLSLQKKDYSVKIIITVRDYALTKIISELRGYVTFKKVSISTFSDDEIKKIIEENYEIKNPHYQERILEIAKGNARIAILASVIAKNNNSLDSINDVSQLYDDYYTKVLENEQFTIDDEMLKSLGMIAFLDVIHMDQMDYVYDFLTPYSVNRDRFIECIYKLHEHEIVDICNDKVVRISDQCLSNYLLKVTFYDKKLLSLSDAVKVVFEKNKEKTVVAINALLRVFRNESLYDFVKTEIRKLWDNLKAESSPFFFDFLKAFYLINPVDTLLILEEEIKQVEKVNKDFSEIVINEKQTVNNNSDDYLNVLCGFYQDVDNIDAALDLIFEYFDKRPDLINEFINYIKEYFGIRYEFTLNRYYAQIKLLKKISNLSNDFDNPYLSLLLLELSKEFLKLMFEHSEFNRNHKFTIYTITISSSDEVKEYRRIIWESLLKINENKEFHTKIYDLLTNYCSGYQKDKSGEIISFDLKYITALLNTFSNENINNCLLAKKFAKLYKDIDEKCPVEYDVFMNTRIFNIYNILAGSKITSDEFDFEQKEKNQKLLIPQFVKKCSLDDFYDVINLCKDLKTDYYLSIGLQIAFDSIVSCEWYIEAVNYYLDKDTPFNISCDSIIKQLIILLGDTKTFDFIESKNFDQKLYWMFRFFCLLPKKYETEKNYNRIISFFRDIEYIPKSTPMYRIAELQRYNNVISNAFISICEILFQKYKNTYMLDPMFGLLFHNQVNSSKEVFTLFSEKYELLYNLYFELMIQSNHADYNGEFLLEIYKRNPSKAIELQIECLVEKQNNYHNMHDYICCFYRLDNYIDIFDRIISELSQRIKYPEYHIPSYFESLLSKRNNSKSEEKIAKLIDYIIDNHNNNHLIMDSLFGAICEIRPQCKYNIVKHFISINDDFESFKMLQLIPRNFSWSGSEIQLYIDWIEDLEMLLPLFTGIKYIKHRDYVEKKIQYLKEDIKNIEIREMLYGY